MDSAIHLNRKLLVERSQTMPSLQNASPTDLPPPYFASERDEDSNQDDYDSDTDDEAVPQMKLTINAQHSIRGNNNLVPINPTFAFDASRFSAMLIAAANQFNNASSVVGAGIQQSGDVHRRRPGLDLTLNCGITIIGDRNVVGHVNLKPRLPASPNVTGLPSEARQPACTTVGAKRKAEDKDHKTDERSRKKPAVS